MQSRPFKGKRQNLSIVIDTDSGIDDAWAILMVLAAAKENNEHCIHLSGITCVHGNTDVNQSCVNVLRTLSASNHLDVSNLMQSFGRPTVRYASCESI